MSMVLKGILRVIKGVFNNKILEHLYTLYGVKLSTTISYSPHSNSACEQFYNVLDDLLRT